MSPSTENDARGKHAPNRNFHHPFQPYDIQVDFMNAVYDCIENQQIGIFESPTDEGEPQWIIDHAREEKRNSLVANKRELEAHLASVRAKEARQRLRFENGEPPRKKSVNAQSSISYDTDEQQFLLDDYESDPESIAGSREDSDQTRGLSAATLDLMSKLGMTYNTSPEDNLEYPDSVKVFYCSRTHSQLMQFAHEVQRVKIPPRLETEVDAKTHVLAEEIKHLSLGSRKNLCINPQVVKLESSTAINERCLELQQPKVGKDARCAFLPRKENEPLLHNFRDKALAKIRDIEDLGGLGKQIGICPYYASRATVRPSEIVTLPYPLLLQKSAREALEISLKGHVVIIDEAHNLMDAISNIYSSIVTLSQLKRARAQLGAYLQRFRNRLKGKNRVYVTQVVRLIDSLTQYLTDRGSQDNFMDGIAKIADLMAGKGVDQINLYKLSQYLQESKLARKVDEYIAFQDEITSGVKTDRTIPVLTNIEGFFSALNNPAAEGRFFYSRLDSGDPCLKYQLLDPTYYFKDIVEDARAVILAGGTMSPMDDYVRHLLSYLEPNRIRYLSCGHVIPDKNLMAWPVTRGPGNVELDFTYGKRQQPAIVDALGRAISHLARSIPDGLVIFFPSYAYLEQAIDRWKSGPDKTWETLSHEKPIFFEDKHSSNVDDVLKEYSDAIAAGKGATLLSVVGGKMSEGINFSDRLGRGVVIVGLPFPNIQSSEWKAKMEYIEKQVSSKGGSVTEGKSAAREFYENACMRAVNQSIGRAIRHKADYASIIMLDKRYSTPRIQTKLPAWIKSALISDSDSRSFSDVISSIIDFFSNHRA